MNIKLLLSSLLISISSHVFSQEIDAEKLDRYFESLAKHDKFMGSVAISKNNEIIYTKSVGFRDLENQKIADVNTRYGIGSISKTFTSVLIFKAMEQDKLSLQTTLRQFFPSIKNAGKITIKQLLNHSSGIHNFTDDEDYLSWLTKPKSEKQMLKIIAKGGSDFEPGAKSQYSNSNYVLLSYVLEHVYGKSYPDILDTYIIQPLGLKSTCFGFKEMDGNVAKSYSFQGSWKLEAETHYSIPLGAGAIWSTPTDLVVFSNALFGGKLVSKESLIQMKSFENNYGLGLFEYPFEGHQGIGHDGAIDGFRSLFTHFEQEQWSYAIISNATNYKFTLLSNAVLSAVFNKPYEVPEFKSIEFNTEELDAFTGVYAGEGLPFKITITRDGKQLIAQATGQSPFPLEAKDKTVFTFDKAGIELLFKQDENSMVLKQSGQEIQLKKE